MGLKAQEGYNPYNPFTIMIIYLSSNMCVQCLIKLLLLKYYIYEIIPRDIMPAL